jgi:hypothetical protein
LIDIRPELPKDARTKGPGDQGTEFEHLHALHGFHMILSPFLDCRQNMHAGRVKSCHQPDLNPKVCGPAVDIQL